MMPLALSVLEQVSVFRSSSPGAAAREAVDLAVATEAMGGYRRFWVAEHHDDPSRACASPEVLSAFIAARTGTIRIGAGCVLLPRTSPRRVAEQWSLVNSLAPGRVDVGIGRGMGPASPDRSESADTFPAQVAELVAALNAAASPDSKPQEQPPLPWLMGSGERGALTAAYLGLPFAFAQFAHDRPRPEIVSRYVSEFRPGALCAEPTLVIAVRVSCAETPEEATRQSLAIWLPALSTQRIGSRWEYKTYPSTSDINEHHLGHELRTAMVANPFLTVTGTPDTVVTTLMQLAEVYGTHDVVLTTTCPDYSQRVRSFALIADQIA